MTSAPHCHPNNLLVLPLLHVTSISVRRFYGGPLTWWDLLLIRLGIGSFPGQDTHLSLPGPPWKEEEELELLQMEEQDRRGQTDRKSVRLTKREGTGEQGLRRVNQEGGGEPAASAEDGCPADERRRRSGTADVRPFIAPQFK